MDLNAVTMDRQFARERFIEYRRAVRARHNAEDEQIMRGYREIARGKQVISLTATLRAGGRHAATGYPRLAVARADAERCWLSACDAHGAVRFVTKRYNDGRSPNNVRDIRDFPTKTLPQLSSWTVPRSPRRDGDLLGWDREEKLYAIVPNVPPALRPNAGLSNFDILWEVDAWLRDPKPPTDPALLRHIGGDLYAVVATWDLTELERLVIAGRAR